MGGAVSSMSSSTPSGMRIGAGMLRFLSARKAATCPLMVDSISVVIVGITCRWWRVRGVCVVCAWRVRGVCVVCAWRMRLFTCAGWGCERAL